MKSQGNRIHLMPSATVQLCTSSFKKKSDLIVNTYMLDTVLWITLKLVYCPSNLTLNDPRPPSPQQVPSMSSSTICQHLIVRYNLAAV